MPRPERQPHRAWDAAGKRIPIRTCAVCRSRRPQAELLRVVVAASGLEIDPKRRLEGRGAYLCLDRPECHTVKALRRFARADAETFAAKLETYLNTVQHAN
jgi:predicted RNA-binding protein YlxR (DUF448 family)